MVVLSHPTSNEFNRAAANGLMKANMLSEFHTSLAFFPDRLINTMELIKPFSEIRRRKFNPILKPVTHIQPWNEIGRHIASKMKIENLIRHETGICSVDAVYQKLDKKVATVLMQAAKKGTKAIYAYEDGALHSFQEAKKLGIQCLYDLPIGYWRSAHKLLAIEQEKWPEWSSTLTGLNDSKTKLERKDLELKLSDQIFVASSFTAKSLEEFPDKLRPVEIIPYGFPKVTSEREYLPTLKDKPLKLLFVGGLSQRKGIANLFAAVEKLGNYVSLTVVGQKASNNCLALNMALAKHTWIPSLPHQEILNLMRGHDVLLFPSLFEGFGLVITEAMSQGTPVITTDRTAGPDIISHGKNGWLVEAGSTRALQNSIEDLLQNPDQIAKVGQAAMISAKNRPWEVYGKELSLSILKHLKS